MTDGEVAEVAVELVATMLDDVRELRHERRDLRGEIDAAGASASENPGLRLALVTRYPWLRSVRAGPSDRREAGHGGV